MSPGTARTMMQSQRLGKHGSGVHRNGLLAEGRSRDRRQERRKSEWSPISIRRQWRHGVFAAINELRSHLITEISER
jgi:hypothetical protein